MDDNKWCPGGGGGGGGGGIMNMSQGWSQKCLPWGQGARRYIRSLSRGDGTKHVSVQAGGGNKIEVCPGRRLQVCPWEGGGGWVET